VAEPVTEPSLFDIVSATYDVEQHSALREPLQRCSLLGGKRRRALLVLQILRRRALDNAANS
jgi:geranylgeranyl pyrophosphate synthase